MYKNSFIVLIKKNGQPLREVNGKEVYIPFNSEYTIELRNNHYRRAVAKITIDGTDILGSREIIIPANGSVTLERFVADGNLNKGKKLKFVPLSNGKVANPTSPENGLIEVEFWLEKPYMPIITVMPYNPQITMPYKYWDNTGSAPNWGGVKYDSYTSGNIGGGVHTMQMRNANTTFCNDTGNVSCCNVTSVKNTGEIHDVFSSLQAGATVEGGRSNQSFTNGFFGEREHPSTTIRMWLRGLDLPITTADSLHCTNCGKKLKSGFKFCPKCGNRVEIA